MIRIHKGHISGISLTAQKLVLEQERQEKVKLKMEAQKKREEIQQHKSEQTAILAKAQNDKATNR
jgi:cell division protein FtsB